GWSIAVLVREFSSLYRAYVRNEEPALPRLEIQYADYAVWQRQWLQGDLLQEQLAYWKKRLADVPVLDLPTDKPRSAIMGTKAGNHPVHLPAELTRKLKQLGRSEGVTVFMSLMAAFNAALSSFSGQKDIAVGSPVANREQLETEGLIGLFVNTLVLRTN